MGTYPSPTSTSTDAIRRSSSDAILGAVVVGMGGGGEGVLYPIVDLLSTNYDVGDN